MPEGFHPLNFQKFNILYNLPLKNLGFAEKMMPGTKLHKKKLPNRHQLMAIENLGTIRKNHLKNKSQERIGKVM